MAVSELKETVVTIRLPRTYDVGLLQRDLEALKSIERAAQPGPYHAGEWKGIALYSMGGKQTAMPSAAGMDTYRQTEALEHAPYMKEILDELASPKEVVRILFLPPGGHIKEHYDYHTNFQYGLIRLHVPIVTHPDVSFVIDNQRMAWNEGELWYGDFSKVHWVKNDSQVTRVHLVIDTQINDFILNLFPADYVERRRAEGISISRQTMAASEADQRRFLCNFQIPGEYLPMFTIGKKLATLAKGARAGVRLIDGELVVLLDNEPAFRLNRVSDDAFSISGLPAGVTLQFREKDNRIGEVILHLKGLPKDLYSARLGFLRGPMLPDRSVTLAVAE
jgi:quercetin dioxygenase-like cupin family protein